MSKPSVRRLVLASASPRRRELLAALGVPFDVMAPNIDEASGERDPSRLAEHLALEKARAVTSRLSKNGAHAVLGADTVVALDGRMLGKPRDAGEARSMLRALRGRTHFVVTGLALVLDNRSSVTSALTEVRMRDYADSEVETYVARPVSDDGPYDKAGAYAIQDSTFHAVEETNGCVCSVIGLPLWPVHSLLRSAGIVPVSPALARCVGCPLARKNSEEP